MSSIKNVLIVEDEIALAELLRDYLHSAAFEVQLIHEGLGVVERVRQSPPDLILLDLMLPGKDGMDICREVRRFSSVPIIMVTARVEEIDRLLGLELGADDYICKPYSPREVVARVKAVLRRTSNQSNPEISARQGVVLDETHFLAMINGQPLDLTPVEFRLLKILNAQPGRVFSRTQLIDNLYEDHRIVTNRTVDTHIKNLRKRSTHLTWMVRRFTRVYGVGYKLECCN